MDIYIVGAGPVGMTLALGLHSQGHNITVLEKNPAPASFSDDARVYAINAGSVSLFKRINIWDDIKPTATPIHTVAVKEFGSTHQLDFDRASNPRNEPYGYMVPSATLRKTLHDALLATPDITLHSGTEVNGIRNTDTHVHLTTTSSTGTKNTTTDYIADVVFAADGKQSPIKHTLNLPEETFTYDHHALVCNVPHEKPHNNVALELFTDLGPLAFLPIAGNASACVFSLNNQLAEAYMRAEPQVFLDKINELYPDYGRFSLGSPLMSFPLSATLSNPSVSGRIMLCGDAALSIHPVAGQGLNVGLQDVATILDKLSNDPGKLNHNVSELLCHIHEERISDRRTMLHFTDGIIRLFDLRSPLVRMGRRAGLMAVEKCPPLKRFFARHAAG